MAFNLFKQKEVIENNDTEKNNNDIVDDFGIFMKQEKINENDLKILSFESNFEENICEEVNELNNIHQVNKVNSNVNHSINFDTSFSDNVNTTSNYQVQNESNIEPFVSNSNNIQKTEDIQSNDLASEYQDLNTNLSNINNFDYNPIMDNLDKSKNNIENSQDVNDVLSNLHNSNSSAPIQTDKITFNTENISNFYSENPITQISDVDPGYKRCPKCGQRMREDYKQCFVCGTMI